MGKSLISQRRGKGSATFRAPSFRYAGKVEHRIPPKTKTLTAEVKDFITCQGHSVPLAKIRFEDGKDSLLLAPEGMRVGDKVSIGEEAPIKPGNTLPLRKLPEGTLVYNIEKRPGDGGKFIRSSGTFGRVVAKLNNAIIISLPSKKEKVFHPNCFATVGVCAGGGRTDKPFLKAGNKYHAMRKKNKFYPHVRGVAKNAQDHPFGGSRSQRKGRSTCTSRNAPPGRKVGMIGARRSGRPKGAK